MKRYFDIIFWVITFIALIFAFGDSYGGFSRSFYFVSFLFPVILGTSVFFNQVLVREYLLKKRYYKFSIYFVYTLVISVYLEILVITGSLVIIANYQYYNLNPKTKDIVFLTIVMYFLVFLNTIFLLVKLYFQHQRFNQELKEEHDKLKAGYLVIKHDRKNLNIQYGMILYIEGVGNYSKFYLSESEPISTKETIGSIEKRLPDTFIRIHRSIIVSRVCITSFDRESVFIDDIELPISRKYKEVVIGSLIMSKN